MTSAVRAAPHRGDCQQRHCRQCEALRRFRFDRSANAFGLQPRDAKCMIQRLNEPEPELRLFPLHARRSAGTSAHHPSYPLSGSEPAPATPNTEAHILYLSAMWDTDGSGELSAQGRDAQPNRDHQRICKWKTDANPSRWGCTTHSKGEPGAPILRRRLRAHTTRGGGGVRGGGRTW
jgi:hypothetical protein